MNQATHLARRLVSEIISASITDVVLSPGSRNAPLSIALYQAEQRGLIKLHVQIDERSAGFFALGIAKAQQRPVALVCTSGTAAANYHPAILEAWHSQVPILAITADRPAALRQTGANQTTLQNRLFQDSTQYRADVSDSDFDFQSGLQKLALGPVHLNIQFDEPLLPDDGSDWLSDIEIPESKTSVQTNRETLEIAVSRGVIVVGHDRAGFEVAQIEKFARELGWPMVCEDPISFVGCQAHAALFLASAKIRETLAPDLVIVIGRTTLSRSTNALIKLATQEIVIDPRTAHIDTRRAADQLFLQIPDMVKKYEVDPLWKSQWDNYSAKASAIVSPISTWSECTIAAGLVRTLPSLSTLYLSSSRPIRDVEAFAKPRGDVETFANRGLAGIDGNISTALGIASQRIATTALMGDLSFLHDHNGLISRHDVNLRIVVINNDGGGIFSTLPQSEVDGFEKIFGTPHGHDLVAMGAATGVPAIGVSTMSELVRELSAPIHGVTIVVAQGLSRSENALQLRRIQSEIESL